MSHSRSCGLVGSLAALALAFPGLAAGVETDLVSRAEGAGGDKGNDRSAVPSISADGRFVAFESHADNLHPDDSDVTPDVFVRSLETHETILVSRASGAGGDKGNDVSFAPSISADGRRIAFYSQANNLHTDDPDDSPDVFVRDLQTHETILVSRASGTDGDKSNGVSFDPLISADGRYVAFFSQASNLHPDDPDSTRDVFVRDLQTHETILVSRASGADGEKGNGSSFGPSISADGRYVAFESDATNLHPDGTGGVEDVFVRDLETHETTLVSRAGGAEGAAGNSVSFDTSISADGRQVAFTSFATNLHPDDTDAVSDVFLRDLETHETTLVSRAGGVDGDKGNNGSGDPDVSTNGCHVSADGRYVAFISRASNLHPDDVDGGLGGEDVFVRDLETHETILVSRASGIDGDKGNAGSLAPSISADGRRVAFQSIATNLHPADNDGISDVFLRLAQVPNLVFVPPSLNFGDVTVGTVSPPQMATLENIGDGDATDLSFTTPASGFEADTGACSNTLTAGQSCGVRLTFAPTTTGSAEGTLAVESAEGVTATLGLAGDGVSPPSVFVPVGLEVDGKPLASDDNARRSRQKTSRASRSSAIRQGVGL